MSVKLIWEANPARIKLAPQRMTFHDAMRCLGKRRVSQTQSVGKVAESAQRAESVGVHEIF